MRSASDRKSRMIKTEVSDELALRIAEFTLPLSLPTSLVDYPILSRGAHSASWREIVAEGDRRVQDVLDYTESKKEPVLKAPFLDTECEYIQEQVFPRLLPALAAALTKARIWKVTDNHKCFFNGIDHVAQELWNSNLRYPERKAKMDHIFNMPWVREELRKNPRRYYPKSWLWPRDYAATVLQSHWRRYLVQRLEEVEEMRDFWRKLKLESNYPNIASNPLLAKKFASSKELHKPKRSHESSLKQHSGLYQLNTEKD